MEGQVWNVAALQHSSVIVRRVPGYETRNGHCQVAHPARPESSAHHRKSRPPVVTTRGVIG